MQRSRAAASTVWLPLLLAVLVLGSGCAAGEEDRVVAATRGASTEPAVSSAGQGEREIPEPEPTPTVSSRPLATVPRDVDVVTNHLDLVRAGEERLARERAAAEAARRAETKKVQEVLAAQGYYPGAVDGEPGPSTTAAVMAFQKVNGLSRDGVIGPQTLAAISTPKAPPLAGGAPTRIEVDLDRQVVHLVKGGNRVRTFNASSGNGDVYTWPDGRVARADTPVGTFSIYRRVNGLRDGDLGAMYDPLYFHQGWAIHGSNHVPGYPASHGCVRLPRSDAKWLAAQVPNGTQVVVFGSVNAFDPRTESVWIN